MPGLDGEQHHLAQLHFGGFTSGRPGDGMFYIYDKTSPWYRNGLPRKIKGGKFERKPPRLLATYGTHHSRETERRMGRVESAMGAEWKRVRAEEGIFSPELIPGIIRYMGLSELRRPHGVRELGYSFRFDHGIVFSEETIRGIVSQDERLKQVQDVIGTLPCWKIHRLGADTDEEYVLCDRPAIIGFGRRDLVACEQSLAFMPMSKKELLVGFWSTQAIEPLTFEADAVNGMLLCKAAKEIYSHRLLDLEKVKHWIEMEPAIRLVSYPEVRLVKIG